MVSHAAEVNLGPSGGQRSANDPLGNRKGSAAQGYPDFVHVCVPFVVRYAYIIASRYQFAKVFLGNNSKIIFWIFFFANAWEFGIISPKIYEQAVNSWPGSPDIL